MEREDQMDAIQELKESCRREDCPAWEAEPMSRHTTFRIGGPADLFLRPRTARQAAQITALARQMGIPVLFLGRGSNLLVSDEGFRGAVITLEDAVGEGPQTLKDGLVSCPAGVSLTALCRFAAGQGLSGLEFAYGIPGSLGGGVFMNAGAYGGELGQVVGRVRFWDPQGGERTLERADLAFSYRHSWFSEHADCLITEVELTLFPGNPDSITSRMEEYLRARREKQPLDYPSAGSTFKRPARAYASQLIDSCGLKGLRVGGAMVSEKHAGFLINYDHATCADVKALVEQVRRIVLERTGYLLECEIKFV